MGALYERAGATQPATEAARRRLLHFLSATCGLPADVVRGSASGIAALIHSRFGSDAASLQAALDQAENARYDRLRPREALLVVRNLHAERDRLAHAIRSREGQAAPKAATFDSFMEKTH